jgi:hypothetical protein
MKGFVMALNLFMTAFSTAISLATADAIRDPYLIIVFAVPSCVGFVSAFVFYWLFRDLDNEEFFVHGEELHAGLAIDGKKAPERRGDSEEESLEKGGVTDEKKLAEHKVQDI